MNILCETQLTLIVLNASVVEMTCKFVNHAKPLAPTLEATRRRDECSLHGRSRD
jgi:hypothetical protein